MAALSITAGSVIPSVNASTTKGTAGATITAGQTLYLDSATSTLKLCDADASAAASTFVGIAMHGASSGQELRYVFKDPALAIGATLVIGDTLWTSGTAGGITKTFTDNVTGGTLYVTVLGTAISTSAINFNPAAAGALTP